MPSEKFIKWTISTEISLFLKIIGGMVAVLAAYSTAIWFIIGLHTAPIQQGVQDVKAQVSGISKEYKQQEKAITGLTITQEAHAIKITSLEQKHN